MKIAIGLGLFVIALLPPLPALGADVEQRSDSGRLWRVSKTGIPDSYVFGTIHAADARVAAIPAKVRTAMQRTRTFATEVVAVALPDAVRLIGVPADEPTGRPSHDLLESGDRLDALVDRPTMASVRAKLGNLEMSDPAIDRLKPWAAMMRATSDATRDGAVSLDEQLLALAQRNRMRVLPLEAAEEQAASFDAIPVQSQVALLQHALAHQDVLAATREDAIASWLAGDIAALSRIPGRIAARYPELTPHYRELIRHIIVNRTAVMHYRSFMEMRKGGVMVAVGAGHLHGEQGLLSLLREDGYRIRRIESGETLDRTLSASGGRPWLPAFAGTTVQRTRLNRNSDSITPSTISTVPSPMNSAVTSVRRPLSRASRAPSCE